MTTTEPAVRMIGAFGSPIVHSKGVPYQLILEDLMSDKSERPPR
jgi:hypothetical protein